MSCDRHCTKTRLMDAAEELFLAKGFETVSIRELATAADVNVAAVNYHFQGKENLYREVIKRRFTHQRDQVIEKLQRIDTDNAGRPPLEDVIRSIVSMHLSAALSPEHGGQIMRLVMRELHSSHGLIAPVFLKELVRPMFRTFSDLMMRARPGLAQEHVDWYVASIVGQIQHFVMRWVKSREYLETGDEAVRIMMHAFPVLERPVGEYIEKVTEHITRFSAAAINALHPEVES